MSLSEFAKKVPGLSVAEVAAALLAAFCDKERKQKEESEMENPFDGIVTEIRVSQIYNWKDAKKAIQDAGYITAPYDYFRIPRIGETFLDVDNKVVTMELRSDPVCGPRLILVKRTKKVLVLDFDEVQEATNIFNQAAEVGEVQSIRVAGFAHEGRWIKGVVEEREV